MNEALAFATQTNILLPYIAFVFFHFYATWATKSLRDSDVLGEVLGLLLGLVSLSATIFKWGYLVYLGLTVTWLAAGALFVVGALASLFVTFFEVRLTVTLGRFVPHFIGWAGIVTLPILAYVLVTATT